MRVFGTMTSEMGKGLSDIQMEIPTMVNSSMAGHMEKVFILGKMVKFMTVSGTKA